MWRVARLGWYAMAPRTLRSRWIRKQPQSLVAVGGHDNMVELFGSEHAHQFHSVGLAPDLFHRRPQADAALPLQGAEHGVHVGPRTSGYGPPVRLVAPA